MNVKFIVDTIKIETKDKNDNTIYDYRTVIKLKNFDNNRSVIHRYTEFLTLYRNRKPNTIKKRAGYITQFLNYLYFELSKEELSDIKYLTFEHGIEYLNNYGKDKLKITVQQCERILGDFYYFLAKKDLLLNIKSSDFSFIDNGKGQLILQSPFKSKIIYPTPKLNTNILHHLDEELILSFILSALEHTPNIAFGVYLQCFGGLRVGEVVNVTYSALSNKGAFGKNGLIIDVKNRNLRSDLKNVGLNGMCKKERKQVVIAVGDLLQQLYMFHMKNYKLSNQDAIFVDNNGNPMTTKTYKYYFNRLKTYFIAKLKNSNNPKFQIYSTVLKNKKWSTHICRGIFSNMIADSSTNASEIAVWRGDSNLNSALTYITDSKKVEEKLIQNMTKFYDDNLGKDFNKILKQ